MNTLKETILRLKSNTYVDVVFLTGSYGLKASDASSDIDLVVILKENKDNIRSVFKWIEGVFADIYFFDIKDLVRLDEIVEDVQSVDWNSMDGILLTWIQKADIQFDNSGKLSALRNKVLKIEKTGTTEKEKRNYWQKVNYNYVANKRYFESKKQVYLEALELRLLYSVSDLICAFLVLRDIPWRGEKNAVLYLKENTPAFYETFSKYIKSVSLDEKFGLYSDMVKMTFTDKYKQWTEDEVVLIKNDGSVLGGGDISGIAKNI